MKTVVFLSDYEDEDEYNAVFDLLSAYDVKGITAKPSEINIYNNQSGTEFYFKDRPLHADLVVGYSYDEDLMPAIKLLQLWKMKNIPILNGPDTLYPGQNKDLSSAMLNSYCGVRHLQYLKFSTIPSENELTNIGYPLVAKPVNGACGRGLFKFDDYMSFKDWVNSNGSIIKDYYVQPYIEKMNNEDFRVVVVNHVAKYAYSRRGANGGWITNLMQNGKGKTFTVDMLPPKLILMAEMSSKAANSIFCGVDIAMDQAGDPFVIEINTCPAIKISKYIPGADSLVEQAYAEIILQELNKNDY